MGIGSGNCGDRLRTIWTPEMDRYFIDLMLEQVNKGNRFDDHLFSKTAWKNMAALFNSKFRSHYEKDVLKNRHKTLRNLYRAVRNLVEQRGFCWDETRQMVTAENHVWDHYIKEHPDARSFRIKTIPYYNDLCLIYKDSILEHKGDTGLDESMPSCEKGMNVVCGDGKPLTLHDMIIDEDYGITGMVENDEVLVSNPNGVSIVAGSRTRTCWQPPMDRYFVDLMMDQVRKGNMIDGVFRKRAWLEMITLFNDKFGFSYNVDVIKNRHKTLKRQHNVVRNLLKLDGFFWDDSRQMVTADDYVWQDYIKAHSDARQFMTRPIPYFKDLRTICDPFSDENKASRDQDSEEDTPTTSISNEKHGCEGLTHQKKKNKRQSGCFNSDHSCSKRSRDSEKGMETALRDMATAVSSLSDKKTSDENSIPIENVIEAVQALPDLDEELILDACDLLEDEKRAKTFMALDVKLRRKWLFRKLRQEETLS